ncbi:MAG: FAD-binding oxidoreductase, partial [Acinetobacter sp.]
MHAIEKQKSPVNSMFDIVLGQDSQALGKIVQKQQSAADTMSLTIQVNRHFKMGQAGQHHPIIIEIKGIRYERTYSLTQLDDQHVLLTVKKVDKGIVSQWLNDRAKIDDVIEFGVPY